MRPRAPEPDIIVDRPGGLLLVEVKQPFENPSAPAQHSVHASPLGQPEGRGRAHLDTQLLQARHGYGAAGRTWTRSSRRRVTGWARLALLAGAAEQVHVEQQRA